MFQVVCPSRCFPGLAAEGSLGCLTLSPMTLSTGLDEPAVRESTARLAKQKPMLGRSCSSKRIRPPLALRSVSHELLSGGLVCLWLCESCSGEKLWVRPALGLSYWLVSVGSRLSAALTLRSEGCLVCQLSFSFHSHYDTSGPFGVQYTVGSTGDDVPASVPQGFV